MLKIIIIDDEKISLDVTASIIESCGFSCEKFNSAEEFLENSDNLKPDLMLVDIYMPGLDGIDLCRELRKDNKWNETPILIMTASDNDVADAFENGANDYIEKPFDARKHIPRLEFHIKAAKDAKALTLANNQLQEWTKTLEFKVEQRTKEISLVNKALREEINERRFLEDRLRYIATHDFLTRLYNRSKLEKRLETLLLEAERIELETSFLLYLDLDQFKVVNEHFGHFAGDELLRQIADILSGFETIDNMTARVGGDEFALLFNAADLQDAKNKSRNLAENISQHEFTWQEQSFYFSISSALIPLDQKWLSPGHILSIADTMIFDIKLKGGGALETYNQKEGKSDSKRLELSWIPQINDAIKNDKFQLFFQEIHPTKTNNSKKAEVLLRMASSERSREILPGHFIDVAEKFHIIKKIDTWVIEKSFKYLSQHDCPFQRLSINLSGESISDRRFLKHVISRMNHYGLDGSNICFEVTETSALHDLKSTQNFIQFLKENTRCKIALDDFGTGQASYAYLKSVPFDILKIDGVFIKEIEKSIVDQKMVKSIVEIAHDLNMTVVAECVENQILQDILIEIGVDWLQGFHLHRPQPLLS